VPSTITRPDVCTRRIAGPKNAHAARSWSTSLIPVASNTSALNVCSCAPGNATNTSARISPSTRLTASLSRASPPISTGPSITGWSGRKRCSFTGVGRPTCLETVRPTGVLVSHA